MQVRSLGWEDPLEKEWKPTPVFLPGEPHGQRSLVGYNGITELDTSERLSTQIKKQKVIELKGQGHSDVEPRVLPGSAHLHSHAVSGCQLPPRLGPLTPSGA